MQAKIKNNYSRCPLTTASGGSFLWCSNDCLWCFCTAEQAQFYIESPCGAKFISAHYILL